MFSGGLMKTSHPAPLKIKINSNVINKEKRP